MVKSEEMGRRKSVPKIDYRNVELPEETMKLISSRDYQVIEESKLTWDSRQFITRIPKEIAEEYKITVANKMRFTLVKPRPDSGGRAQLAIEIV
jgi:hypothetical protein